MTTFELMYMNPPFLRTWFLCRCTHIQEPRPGGDTAPGPTSTRQGPRCRQINWALGSCDKVCTLVHHTWYSTTVNATSRQIALQQITSHVRGLWKFRITNQDSLHACKSPGYPGYAVCLSFPHCSQVLALTSSILSRGRWFRLQS